MVVTHDAAVKQHHWYTILHIGIVLHFAAYIVLAAMLLLTGTATQPPKQAAAATFDVKPFINKSSPDTVHEANPHGVPSYYDWYNNARFYDLTQPRPETTHVNFWGEIYADSTNVHPANTRVALKNCQFWGLISGTWTQLQNTTLGGGAWTEDYSSYVTTMDIRTESDGSQSIYPRPNQNAHFWADTGFWNATGVTFQAVITTCQTRLVLADVNGVDDRDSARYIVSMGADWRQPDGSCPFIFGSYICEGLGHGRYIRVTKEWRTAVMTSMSTSDLQAYSAPPSTMFLQPDGSYPDMAPEISSFSASPSSTSAGSSATLSWSIKGAASLSINQGVGTVTGSTKSVTVPATTSYTLTAVNSAGSATASTTVTVPGSTPVPNSSNGGTGGSNGNGGTASVTPTPAVTDSNGDGTIDENDMSADTQTETDNEVPVGGVKLPGLQSKFSAGTIGTQMTSVEKAGIVAGIGMVLFSSAAFVWWLRFRKR